MWKIFYCDLFCFVYSNILFCPVKFYLLIGSDNEEEERPDKTEDNDPFDEER